MNKKELCSIIRCYLNDIHGEIWSDTELYGFIESAVKDYCTDTCAFNKQTDIFPLPDGTYQYPNDFIKFNIGWNSNGENIEPSCSHELQNIYPDFSARTNGVPVFIYDDLDNNNCFSLFPVPEQNPDFSFMDYGVLQDSDYGIPVVNDEYGVCYVAVQYKYIGKFMYSHIAVLGEIRDYNAIVFNVCSRAFNTDSDFSDANKAAFYKAKYDSRISMFKQIMKKYTGETMKNNFF